MSTHRFFDKICVIVILFALILTVVFMNGAALGLQTYVDADSDSGEENQYFTANDLNGSWDSSDATTIILTGTDAEISGDGAYMLDGDLLIAKEGKYVITGELTDGKITVDTTAKSKVWILLDGVTITNSDDCCLKVEEADKVFLTLAEGSENAMTSGDTYSEESLADNTDGVIFAHDDLTINGTGDLTVTSAYKHAIAANDDLIIAGGNLTLTSAEDAIHVNDSIHITTADITIDAGDDGIHCDTEVYIQDGTITINTCYEGIEAPSIQIDGGTITIYPTDDGLNANGESSLFGGMMMQGKNAAGFDPAQTMDSSQDPNESADETASDDTETEESMPQMPQQSEDGSTPQMPEQSTEEGMPQMPQQSEDGSTPQMPEQSTEEGMPQMPQQSEDGSTPQMPEQSMNEGSAPAMDGEASTEMQQNADMDASDDETSSIIINGGILTIINESGMDADGIDSNGNITINGGTILVSVASGSCALDYGSENGGQCLINGGTIIAAGGSSMAESFEEDSTQASVSWTGNAESGSVVEVLDSDGNVILSDTVPCAFSYLIFSCPQMSVGDTITLSVNDADTEISLDNTVTTVVDENSASSGFSQMQGQSMQDGGMTQPNGAGQMQDGSMNPQDGAGQMQDGSMTPPDGNGQMPQGNMTPPDGNGQMPQGNTTQSDAGTTTQENSSQSFQTTE